MRQTDASAALCVGVLFRKKSVRQPWTGINLLKSSIDIYNAMHYNYCSGLFVVIVNLQRMVSV